MEEMLTSTSKRELEAKILSEAGRILESRRASRRGPAKVLRPCPYCKRSMGARELAAHLVVGCPMAPKKSRRRRAPVLLHCPWCNKRMASVVLRVHVRHCNGNPDRRVF